ncbi:MAG: putative capsid protein [Circoviridae sp.]|nr:MAG: putative capsid protein [Circoviridae sp.]
MPIPAKRARTMYPQRSRFARRRKGINVMRTSPGNQMSMYMSRNNPFPAVEYATLRYVTKVTIAPSANGFVGFHSYRANSIYDPDYTNLTTGGQPYGYAQYATLYNHYKVIGSQCTVQAVTSASGDFPGFGIALDDDNSFSSDPQKMLSAKGSTYTMSTSGAPQAILSRKYNPSMVPEDAVLDADFGASPAQDFYFRIFTITEETNRSIAAVVTINYRVKMYGLKNLTN